MTAGALALVLTAAVAHALWNLAAKRVTADRVVFVLLYVVGSVALWVPLGIVWAVVTEQRPSWTWLLAAAVSALLHVVYNLVLVHGYAAGDLNLVYPLARGVGPLVVWADKRFTLGHGRVVALYVMAYTAGRGWIEALRIDDVQMNDVFGLRLNVWVSIVMFLAAAAYFVWSARRDSGRETDVRRHPAEPEPAEPATDAD